MLYIAFTPVHTCPRSASGASRSVSFRKPGLCSEDVQTEQNKSKGEERGGREGKRGGWGERGGRGEG